MRKTKLSVGTLYVLQGSCYSRFQIPGILYRMAFELYQKSKIQYEMLFNDEMTIEPNNDEKFPLFELNINYTLVL